MRSYSLIAAAKVNLYLEIIGDRPDGFHELVMILQSISLADRLELRPLGTDEIRILCNHPEVPTDQRNLSYKAAALLAQEYPEVFARYGGVEITIDKKIPVGAGLAGGSSNAAAVLIGLNLMWQLGLTQPELQELGARLGSDVPFCLAGGTVLATGRGEKLDPLPDLISIPIVLAKYRSLSVSTAWAYQTYRQQFKQTYLSDSASFQERHQHIHSGPLVNAISRKDVVQIGQRLCNDLEKVVLPQHPQVQQLRDQFQQLGCAAMMSGSGPTVFALANSIAHAEEVRDRVQSAIANPDLDLWVAEFTNNGISLAA